MWWSIRHQVESNRIGHQCQLHTSTITKGELGIVDVQIGTVGHQITYLQNVDRFPVIIDLHIQLKGRPGQRGDFGTKAMLGLFLVVVEGVDACWSVERSCRHHEIVWNCVGARRGERRWNNCGDACLEGEVGLNRSRQRCSSINSIKSQPKCQQYYDLFHWSIE